MAAVALPIMPHAPGGAKPGAAQISRARRPESATLSDLMKTLVCLVFAFAAAISAGSAKEFKLPADKPVASIDIPDAWNPTAIQRGYQTQTADQEVYLSIETTSDEKEMSAIIDETDAMLKSHKVVLNKVNRKDNKFKVNGLPAEELLYNGKDEDGPTMVSITFVTIRKAAVVFTYWASVEGNKKHQDELGKILNSLRALTP